MRFNTLKQKGNMFRNRAGGDACVQTPEMQLISLLLTSFVQDQFYRPGRVHIRPGRVQRDGV